MNDNLIPIDFKCIDLLEDSDYDELIYDYCEKVHKKEDYGSADSMMQNILALEYFPNVTFHKLLSEYFEEQEKDIEEEVRGYLPYKQGFLMTHGIGYAWESHDLFGGNNDGRGKKDFEDWLEKKGFYLQG